MQNKNKIIDINNNTRLSNDCCVTKSRLDNNMKMYEYSSNPFLNDLNRESYLNSSNQVGLYQKKGGDGKGMFIDNESKLLIGKKGNIMTSGREKGDKLLQVDNYFGVPFKGNGETILSDPDLKSKMLYGEITNFGKSSNSLSGISINRFTPLIPSISQNIQNPEHIIPSYWVNGGLSTRNNVKNINYLKSCGKK
jgi:hypothetical protein